MKQRKKLFKKTQKKVNARYLETEREMFYQLHTTTLDIVPSAIRLHLRTLSFVLQSMQNFLSSFLLLTRKKTLDESVFPTPSLENEPTNQSPLLPCTLPPSQTLSNHAFPPSLSHTKNNLFPWAPTPGPVQKSFAAMKMTNSNFSSSSQLPKPIFKRKVSHQTDKNTFSWLLMSYITLCVLTHKTFCLSRPNAQNDEAEFCHFPQNEKLKLNEVSSTL